MFRIICGLLIILLILIFIECTVFKGDLKRGNH